MLLAAVADKSKLGGRIRPGWTHTCQRCRTSSTRCDAGNTWPRNGKGLQASQAGYGHDVSIFNSCQTSWLCIALLTASSLLVKVDDPAATAGAVHKTPANKGNEAMAYLSFIIDYYPRLPASMVFLHGHRRALRACTKVLSGIAAMPMCVEASHAGCALVRQLKQRKAPKVRQLRWQS